MDVDTHQGAVLYYWNEHLDADWPHWHIVINPCEDSNSDCWVAICTSSQVEAFHKKIDQGFISSDTVVFVPKHDYIEFTKNETAINCHSVDSLSRDEIDKMRQNPAKYKLKQCKNFPRKYVARIVDGVLLSEETDNAIRASLLRVEEEEVSSAMFARFGMKLKDFLPEMYKHEADKNTFIPKPGIKIVVTPK